MRLAGRIRVVVNPWWGRRKMADGAKAGCEEVWGICTAGVAARGIAPQAKTNRGDRDPMAESLEGRCRKVKSAALPVR